MAGSGTYAKSKTTGKKAVLPARTYGKRAGGNVPDSRSAKTTKK